MTDKEAIEALGYSFVEHHGFGACRRCCFICDKNCKLEKVGGLPFVCSGGYYIKNRDEAAISKELVELIKNMHRTHS